MARASKQPDNEKDILWLWPARSHGYLGKNTAAPLGLEGSSQAWCRGSPTTTRRTSPATTRLSNQAGAKGQTARIKFTSLQRRTRSSYQASQLTEPVNWALRAPNCSSSRKRRRNSSPAWTFLSERARSTANKNLSSLSLFESGR